MRVQAAELISTGDVKQDRARVTGRTVQQLTERQLRNTYDIQLPSSFTIDTSSHVMNIDSISSSTTRDIIRLNLDNNNESFTLVNKLRNAMYGEKELPGSVDTYNRKALERYVNTVLSKDVNFKKSEALKNIKADIAEKDFNIDVTARKIIQAMQDVKSKDISAGILKEIETPTLDLDPLMIKTLDHLYY